MYPSADQRELTVLLRIARDLDIIGDVSVTVDNPSELLAWADVLPEPGVVAWRTRDSGKRFAQVSTSHGRSPIHGEVTVVLGCEQHRAFWDELVGRTDLEPGATRVLSVKALSSAWDAMPITPPEDPGVGLSRGA